MKRPWNFVLFEPKWQGCRQLLAISLAMLSNRLFQSAFTFLDLQIKLIHENQQINPHFCFDITFNGHFV